MKGFDGELIDGSSAAAVERKQVYLHPGELIATREPAAVKTILGSCIAVCLWDGDRGIGGMNHFVVPRGAQSASTPGRFGLYAIAALIDAMVQEGARMQRMQAKLFGGATMLVTAAPRANHVGAQNLAIAIELLERAGIPIVGSDVGGARGRKIVFHTDDGGVALWAL
jgi:chemotaxis protein CheD